MKGRIGLYSIGLKTYWAQFPELETRLKDYNKFIERKIKESGAEVYNFGMVDDIDKARACGEYFNAKCVDLIFLHVATYATLSLIHI